MTSSIRFAQEFKKRISSPIGIHSEACSVRPGCL